ncbi:MAG: hypothetical protein RLZZ387_1233, partial [Chloroflexota bacterium]
MSRLSALIALCVVMLAASLAPSPSAAQFELFASRAERNFAVSGARFVKFPGVTGLGNQVFVSGNSGTSNDGRDAVVWQKEDAASSFSTGVNIGDARGQSDYSNTSIASNRFDNTIHAAWIDQDIDQIKYRSRSLDGDWGPTHIAVSGSGFRAYMSVGVASDNRVFIVWTQQNRIRFVTSDNGGSSWTDPTPVMERVPIARPFVTGGPNGSGVVTFSGSDGNIYAGTWNGGSWDMSRVTNKGADDYFTSPTATITPDGKIFVAWREGAKGVYYSQRQPDGSWAQPTRIAGGPIIEAVPIVSDSQGNIHLFWTGTASGSNDVYYTFKAANETRFGSIVRVAGPGGLVANISGAATLSSRGFGHVVAERFVGSGLETRYFLFSSDAVTCGGTITFDNNATATVSTLIEGSITADSGCTPTQYRIALNAQDDSQPLQTFNGRFAINVPAGQIGLCTQTVNVRLIQGTNVGGWISKTIKVDPGTAATPVNAALTLENVHLMKSALAKDIASNGPSDGAPGFTRVPQATLRVQDTGDCSGLKTVTAAGGGAEAITDGTYAKNITLPGVGIADEGRVSVPVTVVDNAGNRQTFNRSIIYDPASTEVSPVNQQGLPVIEAAGTLTVNDTADARRTILRTL